MRLAKAAALAALVLATSLPSLAREKRVKIDDLPEVVKQTVLEVSQGAKLRELTREVEKGETIYEVELEVNGRIRDVSIDSSGAVVLIEEEVDWDSVPGPVRATIEKEGEGRKLLLVETLTRNDTVEAYEAHFRKGWWRELEVKVDPQGRLLEKK